MNKKPSSKKRKDWRVQFFNLICHHFSNSLLWFSFSLYVTVITQVFCCTHTHTPIHFTYMVDWIIGLCVHKYFRDNAVCVWICLHYKFCFRHILVLYPDFGIAWHLLLITTVWMCMRLICMAMIIIYVLHPPYVWCGVCTRVNINANLCFVKNWNHDNKKGKENVLGKFVAITRL